MKKSMRKIFIVILAVICFACIGLAVTACKENNYYVLTFEYDEGITVEGNAQSGAQVKEGYEIKFTVSVNEDAFGDPSVTVNEVILKADSNGVYSFKMQGDTKVSITGVSLLGTYEITFGNETEVEMTTPSGDTKVFPVVSEHEWVRFYDLEGKPLTKITATSGEAINFKVDIGVYYEGYPYTVAAGSAILRPDSNGVYTYTVTGKQTVAVRGLPDGEATLQDSFVARTVKDANGNDVAEGIGTSDSPFRIKTPLDLYYLAKLLPANSFLSASYYVLDNDIDMKGERLYVIGDRPDDQSQSLFCGTFDGQGYTISNYYMTDTYLDYDSAVEEFIPEVQLRYIGLFGWVQPSTSGNAGIYNLNLENFEIHADGGASGIPIFVGGLVGYGMGVSISNCSVSGTIVADGDSNYFGYVGGLIGIQESAYLNDSTNYYSIIQSCSSDVTVRGDSGYLYAAGGIAGYQMSVEERTTAAILNCYSTGNVSGAMRVGGITGMAGSYTSIKNCYATGNISARSTIQMGSGDTEYHLAYAGGIAGYAQYGSVISNSFFTGTTNVRAAAGNAYAHKGGIAGGTDADGAIYIHTDGAVIYNCLSEEDHDLIVSDDLIKSTLGWAEADWSFSGNGRPVINKEAASKSFTVQIMVNGKREASLNVTEDSLYYYIPLSYWYYEAMIEEGDNKIPDFIGTGSARTYGYYFDEACTQKIPLGFIPTDDITFYAKFVDYSEVTGVYYIENGNGKHFELTDDGYVIYRDGAVSCISTYLYNGEYLILQNTFFAIIVDEDFGFYTFKAEIKNGAMEIYAYTANVYVQDQYGNNTTEIKAALNYTAASPLKAIKKLDNFGYGSYFDASGTQYKFNEDGTGLWGTDAITYTVSGNAITVTRNGTVYSGTLNADGEAATLDGERISLTRYDIFKGVWESSANTAVKYEFDGKGGWTCGSASGSYENNGGGSITLEGGITVEYDNGFLKINGETYYRENSFVGTWVYTLSQPVTLTLNGISADGYGTAVITYSALQNGVYEVNYTAVESNGRTYIVIYNNYELYATLSYNAQNKTLTGSFYVIDNLSQSMRNNARFCLYDDFKGTWSGTCNSDSTKKLSITFNGYGNYNLPGSNGAFEVRGKVSVGNNDYNGIYLDDGELISTLIIGGKTYSLEYDEVTKVITVTCDGETYSLTKN